MIVGEGLEVGLFFPFFSKQAVNGVFVFGKKI